MSFLSFLFPPDPPRYEFGCVCGFKARGFTTLQGILASQRIHWLTCGKRT